MGVAQTAYFKLLPVLVICPSSVKLKYVIETHKHTHTSVLKRIRSWSSEVREYASTELLGVAADDSKRKALRYVQVVNSGSDSLSKSARVIIMGYDLYVHRY